MRKLAFMILLLTKATSYGQSNKFYDQIDQFYAKYVSNNGLVAYQNIQKNEADLNLLIEHLESYEWTKDEEKAYLINAYNLYVIQKVLAHYPIDSPMKVNKFFDAKDVVLNGEKYSLNEIENKLLRPVYKDARMHFALVCGALGCPVLASAAYRPELLDEQLNTQTKQAINNNQFVYQDSRNNVTYVSEIFEWYKEDFGGKNDSIFAFINRYREPAFTNDYPIQSYSYDWTLNDQKFAGALNVSANETGQTSNNTPTDTFNLQTFTAGGLLDKNRLDITLFNTLYTENKSNWLGQDFTGFRATFVTYLFQFTYGISKSKRINLGLDLYLRNNGRSVDSTAAGIATAFGYSNTDSTRFALTSVAPRIKIQPFRSVRNFSIQSSVIIPIIPNAEGIFIAPGDAGNRYWGDWDRITWWNQFFFDKTWGKFQLFTEVDLWFRFKKNSNQYTALDIPMSAFFSYFPTSKMTFYVMSQHVPRLTYNINQPDPPTDWVIPMNYTASGVGFKYNFSRSFNIELLYTNFWRGQNSGLGQTFNLGIKYITP